MTDDLIERLEAWAEDIQLDGYAKGADLDLKEAAARIRELEQGVGVKSLEWSESHKTPGYWRSTNQVGAAYVVAVAPDGRVFWFDTGRQGRHYASNIDAAKAAAQPDYEARIRSALTPAPVTVQEAARENIVDEIEEIISETHDLDVTDRNYAENIVGWLERHHPAALSALAGQGGEV